jgi:aspartate 1-decarboxylase
VLRTLMSAKIHRATVTEANPDYVGSITIDSDLLAAADLVVGEQVHVVSVDSGARLITYAISGPAGSGTIAMNGAAARLIHPGDTVIIIAYAQLTPEEMATHAPRVVHVDSANRIVELGSDPGASAG